MWEELKKGKEKTKMPGIAKKPNNSGDCCDDSNTSYKAGNGSLPHHSFNGPSVSDKGLWSKPRDDVGYNQLQKFWRELALPARQKLLRIDKQTLLEHARKNMYCSRCNGLLLEGFLQISMYGRSLQQEAANSHDCGGSMNNQNGECSCMSKSNKSCNDFLDPAVHPWGGLTTTRDGMLTILDFYLYSESLKGLCNVFDSARARERERKLLYPDACGGGRRGWISQGMSGYGRGHATREACALHTARLSVETLLDFWSSLGEETQQSLLRIKEEDFIERLIYRFESKRFCRDCRRNVIREFKELKELKRLQKEPHCTSWFCVADTAFQYEVSHDTVQADWHQTFQDAFGTYRYFEWAIGTGDGKSDIMEFENVGLCGRVYVNGLDLSGLSACYITLKAWKNDGCYNKFCVKAYALRGKQCVHGRLVVADGYVTIMIRESIRRFFEHAEEAEEEEDDDSMEKDGNEIDGECSRPQKHAKNPELAREFLHDAATIIFKEQVEKAFRDGTARQNAHSIFVSHALKLLEGRLFVACKEIITLEKQMKLLEEEEKEKREEEERRERKRTKEREKKMRRKERLREKENKEKYTKSNIDIEFSDVPKEDSFPCIGEDANVDNCRDSESETCETTLHNSLLPGIRDDPLWMEGIFPNMQYHNGDILDGGFGSSRNQNPTFPCTHITYSRRKLKPHKDSQQDFILKLSSGRKAAGLSINETSDGSCESRFHDEVLESARSTNSSYKQVRANAPKSYTRNGCPRMSEKHQFENHGRGDRYDAHVRSCNRHIKHRSRSESHISRAVQGSKVKITAGNTFTMKKVWEPLDSQKRDARGDQGFDVTSRSKFEVECDQFPESFDASSSYEIDIQDQFNNKDDNVEDLRSGNKNSRDKETEFSGTANSQNGTKVEVADDGEICSMEKSSQETDSSVTNSDNSSSSLSEGDSLVSSHPQNVRCMSALDLDESCQISDGRDLLVHPVKSDQSTDSNGVAEIQCTVGEHDAKGQVSAAGGPHSLSSLPTEGSTIHCETGRENVRISAHPDSVLPQMLSQRMQYPMFHAAPVMGGCYQQNPISWPAVPTNGLLPFPYSNQYMYANSYGYDLSGNTQLMPYGTVLHLAPPPHWLNHPSHVPVLPSVPAAPVNGVHINEYHKVASSVEGVHGTVQMEPTVKEAAQNEKVEDSDGEKNDGFSLFHFGGPVALSAGGFKADAVSLEEGGVEKTSCSELLENGNHPCSRRKDCIEEYNLFAAASTGIKFSIV